MSTAEAGAATILAVDDNPANLALLSDLLRDRYRVLAATSGERALELALSGAPDLVLLDVMMPGIDGPEVLARMRGEPRLRHVPVVMVSAVDEVDTVVRCIELGADDYLAKPFDPTLLRARIGACLERKRLHDAVEAQAAELRAWNEELERRVQAQVTRLNRLEGLKRFFAPQVVTSIMEGADDVLRIHRREVVVVFLDMRGFTAFTDRSEPEEVTEVLAAYHREMGRLVTAYEGTLEHFEGDGMMIFFNDPVLLERPAENAVRMALAMQESFRPLQAAWRRRGHSLGLGVGIAQGYATLGAIGYEDRWEYACIGGVTNRAARLCGEAAAGQILLDERTCFGIEDLFATEPMGDYSLKGFTHPVPVYGVVGIRGGGSESGLR